MQLSTLELVWISLIAGIVATVGMTLVLIIISKSGYANADMVRAIGSLFTKNLSNAYPLGLAIHTASGIVFAFLYIFAITSFNVTGFISSIGAGVLAGFVHGAVVSFMLVASVAEHHPLKEFQKAGFSVAVAHWIAHVVYGFLIGLVLAMSAM